MKKIIPFKKDIEFKTNLSEITSISLENTLSFENNNVVGDFIISGDYKVSDSSNTVEPFEFKLPFEIVIDDRFDTKDSNIDIDDFYYEIINDNTLSISIDVLIDHLNEKLIDNSLIDVTPERYIINSEDDNLENGKEEFIQEVNETSEERGTEESIEEDIVEDKINSIFNKNSFDGDQYVTYNIFIVRDGDTIDSILEKYNTTLDELKKYNDLSNLQLGDKLIIPNVYERD